MYARTLTTPIFLFYIAFFAPSHALAELGSATFGAPAPGESVLGGLEPAAGNSLQIELSPSTAGPVSNGDNLSLTISFTGLTPDVDLIGSFRLVVLYDHTLLNATGSNWLSTSKLTDGPPPVPSSFAFTSLTSPTNSLVQQYAGTGFVFSQASLEDSTTLATLQTGQTSFDAIEILFQAQQDGTPAFSYVYDPEQQIDVRNAAGDPYVLASAPIPPAWTLIGAGMAVLLRLRARSRT